MCELSLNLEDFRNIALIIISSLVALISFNQYKVNKERYSVDYHKFRLDLFNKRYQVFQDTLSLYKQTIEDEVTSECFNSFNVSYNSSFFLYPKDSGVYDLIDEIHKKFIRIRGLRKTMIETGPTQDSFSYSQELIGTLSVLSNDIKELKIKLEPFLSFSDFKTNS